MFIILALCLSFLIPFQEKPDQFKQQISGFRNKSKFSAEYDKFTDQTLVSVGPFFIGNSKRRLRSATELYMSARFEFPGTNPNGTSKSFALVFRAHGVHWEFLERRHLYAVIDGERLDLGEGSHDGDVRRVGVSELLIFEVPAETFQKLANARLSDLKIGNFELTLKDEHSEAFRNLYSLSTNKSGGS